MLRLFHLFWKTQCTLEPKPGIKLSGLVIVRMYLLRTIIIVLQEPTEPTKISAVLTTDRRRQSGCPRCEQAVSVRLCRC